jgi:hypothetical protein
MARRHKLGAPHAHTVNTDDGCRAESGPVDVDQPAGGQQPTARNQAPDGEPAALAIPTVAVGHGKNWKLRQLADSAGRRLKAHIQFGAEDRYARNVPKNCGIECHYDPPRSNGLHVLRFIEFAR